MQRASPLWQRSCSRDYKLKVKIYGKAIVFFTDPSSGFIAAGNNDAGILHPDPAHKPRNAKGKFKQQRTVRQKYGFVTASKRGQRYRDYFNPDSTVQLRVMGMEDTVVRITPLADGNAPFLCLSCGRPLQRSGTSFVWHLGISDIIMHRRTARQSPQFAIHRGLPNSGK